MIQHSGQQHKSSAVMFSVHLQITERRVLIFRGMNLLKNGFSSAHADAAEW